MQQLPCSMLYFWFGIHCAAFPRQKEHVILKFWHVDALRFQLRWMRVRWSVPIFQSHLPGSHIKLQTVAYIVVTQGDVVNDKILLRINTHRKKTSFMLIVSGFGNNIGHETIRMSKTKSKWKKTYKQMAKLMFRTCCCLVLQLQMANFEIFQNNAQKETCHEGKVHLEFSI